MFFLAISTKICKEDPIFSESVDLKIKKQKQNKKSACRFFGNATYNTCAKFQGKIANRNLVGGPRSFRFLNKRHVFGKEKIFVKNYSPVFFSAEDNHTT